MVRHRQSRSHSRSHSHDRSREKDKKKDKKHHKKRLRSRSGSNGADNSSTKHPRKSYDDENQSSKLNNDVERDRSSSGAMGRNDDSQNEKNNVPNEEKLKLDEEQKRKRDRLRKWQEELQKLKEKKSTDNEQSTVSESNQERNEECPAIQSDSTVSLSSGPVSTTGVGAISLSLTTTVPSSTGAVIISKPKRQPNTSRFQPRKPNIFGNNNQEEDEDEEEEEKSKIGHHLNKQFNGLQSSMSSFQSFHDDKPSSILQKNENSSINSSFSGKKLTGESVNQKLEENATTTTEEIDPLDAFMEQLESTEAFVQQDPIGHLPRGGSVSENISNTVQDSSKLSVYGSNTITLEEVLAGIRQRDDETDWESEIGSPKHENEIVINENESKEEREEREHREFMAAIKQKVLSDKEKLGEESEEIIQTETDKIKKSELGRIWAEDGDIMEEDERMQQEQSALEILQEAAKRKELKLVDHYQINYLKFQKNFFVLPRSLASLSEGEIKRKREKMEIKIRGLDCPPPVDTWEQCGLSDRILAVINKHEFSHPFAIQKQAIPAIMCGRDVIGIAKTGSGKTLAFLLPMFRHILAQPPIGEGEGPIGLILAPARELAVQIRNEAKKFTKALGLRVTAVYGGAGVAEQIADLKRGADIVVCTPGRMIDILCMQAGKLVSLERVTFIVLDEADRMFDMGFEPQIKMILQNIRPDRQTVLFSATFPKQVEALAKKILKAPLEIVVGGKSVASEDIAQYVEVYDDEDEKFMRLLQLLGVWYEKGNVLVFVDTQRKCDLLFQDLTRSGYRCLSLHGGKDQIDRDCTIDEFRKKVRTLMVATSVAGRGLDVPDLVCVINYSCPNHPEDYVHRVGRTGRAGRKGTAYTFISQEEEQYSPILVRALEQAKQPVPEPLLKMSESFKLKVESGQARWASSGFGGKGFTFDENEKNDAQKLQEMQIKQYQIEHGMIDTSESVFDSDDETQLIKEQSVSVSHTALSIVGVSHPNKLNVIENAKKIAERLAQIENKPIGILHPTPQNFSPAAFAKAQAVVARFDLNPTGMGPVDHYMEELEINDYPQQARWKVTHRDTMNNVAEMTGAAVITRGTFFPTGRNPAPGERKLYLVIEGSSEKCVQDAKKELQRILNEETLRIGAGSGSGSSGGTQYKKYSVV